MAFRFIGAQTTTYPEHRDDQGNVLVATPGFLVARDPGDGMWVQEGAPGIPPTPPPPPDITTTPVTPAEEAPA